MFSIGVLVQSASRMERLLPRRIENEAEA